ncbi:MAG: NADH-quinone oxidoreductase subunit C [Ignavibacteriales bacterium]|nr:NADH-quinone oxidoreductase subunit C [Ignavibacteriales bacterium]
MDRTEEFLNRMQNKIFNIIKKKKRLYFEVKNENVREVADYLFTGLGCRLSTATATEVYNGLEVLYHFSHDETGDYFCPRIIIVDKKNPRMNSITPIVKGAEWIEREMFDLFGIDFEGHPRKELLLTGNHPKGLRQPLRITKLS